MVDVLFVGGGRRVSLARQFKAAGLRVAGYEKSAAVPLASEALMVSGRSWQDEDFASHLSHTARQLGATIVLPLDCRGVLAVERVYSRDLDRRYVVSTHSTAFACLDKDEFALRCPDKYYPHPIIGRTYVEKPACGFGSRNVTYGDSHHPTQTRQGFVRQRRLAGPEYSVDAYFDRNNRLVSACPRERVRVAGGEIIESVTVNAPDLVDAVRAIGEQLPFRGPTCFQFMREAERPMCIEVNARFGGGAPLSIKAGWDAVNWLVTEYYFSQVLRPPAYVRQPRVGVRTVRSYEDHFFG